MNPFEFIASLGDWVTANLPNIIFSLIIIIVGYIISRIIARELRTLRTQKKLEEHAAYTVNRILKWVIFLIVFSIILAQFGITLGTISGLLTLLGGTIIGFAAINTIGNAISGLIVMTSRPFRVGDRIFFNGKFADVVAIELIYTKMITLDNVLVSVPNQELLKAEIDNFGKKKVVRRHVTVTPGFEYETETVEKALLEAALKVPRVLKEPKPYVWITKFRDYAVEYVLYVFINDIKGLPEIDAEIHKKVFETCKEHGIDISTPLIIRKLENGKNGTEP